MKIRLGILALGALFSFLLSCNNAQNNNQISRKQQVVALLKAFETGDTVPISYINSEKYTQHNLHVADGVQGFREAICGAAKSGLKVNTLRIFEDGDYVFAQSLTSRPDDSVELTFDIFRYEGDKIVEHWDNTYVLHAPTDPQRFNDLYLGAVAEIKDRDKTQANKKLAEAYTRYVLLQDSIECFPEFADTENYIERNPYIEEAIPANLRVFVDNERELDPPALHKVLGEGDYVLVVSEKSDRKNLRSALYDLFRIANGKIVEHWFITEPIPPQSEWKNKNGKFGF